jgi:hypothetical protein
MPRQKQSQLISTPPPSPSQSQSYNNSDAESESSDDEPIIITAKGQVKKRWQLGLRPYPLNRPESRDMEEAAESEIEPLFIGSGLSQKYSNKSWRSRTVGEILEDGRDEDGMAKGEKGDQRRDRPRAWYSPCRWIRGKY